MNFCKKTSQKMKTSSQQGINSKSLKKIVAAFGVLFFIASIIYSISISAIGVSNDDLFTSGDYTYRLINGNAEITDYAGKETDISVPSLLDGNLVTQIGHNAYSNAITIKSIHIPASVTYVDYSAFAGCDNIERITVDSNNLVYDSRNNCNAIIDTENNKLVLACDNTSIPNNVIHIGDWAFSGCKRIKKIELPHGVESLGWATFFECHNLEEIVIPDTVNFLGYTTFSGCKKLKKINIPKNIDCIHKNTFENCYSLTSVVLPDSIKTIGQSAFCGCNKLENIFISDSVTNIGSYAFAETAYFDDPANRENGMLYIGKHLLDVDPSLESIIINPDTKSIAYDAFDECENLKNIIISDSVKNMNSHSFEDTAYYKDFANWENGMLYIGNHLVCVKKDKSGSLTVKPGTVSISSNICNGCTKIKEVIIPSSVDYIGGSAFSNCKALEKITVDKHNEIFDSRDNCNAVIETKSNLLLYG